ncbi:hypothetical protein NC652_005049 [Populus alba x Populus x berolinensis]|nr:hypothetical protein NC652_005049 [Populus alba x Populus x berolinensis]
MEEERGPKSTVVEDRRTSLLGGGIAGIYSVQRGYFKVYGKKFRAEIVKNTEAHGDATAVEENPNQLHIFPEGVSRGLWRVPAGNTLKPLRDWCGSYRRSDHGCNNTRIATNGCSLRCGTKRDQNDSLWAAQ